MAIAVQGVARRFGEFVALDDVVRRAGRRDDDVGAFHLIGQRLEAHGLAGEPLGETDRAVVVAVGDEDRLDSLCRERAGSELGCLAGADDQHPALLEVAQRSPRKLERDRRHRGRPL